MTRHLILVGLIAACGGGAGKATTPVGNTGGAPTDVPAPLYAALFVDGATFRYDVETSSSHWDDTDPKADAHGNVNESAKGQMSCRVTGVTRLTYAVAATLVCDDAAISVPVGGASPAGTYVATSAGLWRTDAVPDDAGVAALDPKQMILPPQPVAREASEEPEEGFGTKVEVVERGDGAWCWASSSWGGDEGGVTLCFGGGKLVGGSAYFGGGSTSDVNFELVK